MNSTLFTELPNSDWSLSLDTKGCTTMEQAVNIKKKLCDNKSIYFIGIAGTGMASAAGLFKEAGYEVAGSDEKVYPYVWTSRQDAYHY